MSNLAFERTRKSSAPLNLNASNLKGPWSIFSLARSCLQILNHCPFCQAFATIERPDLLCKVTDPWSHLQTLRRHATADFSHVTQGGRFAGKSQGQPQMLFTKARSALLVVCCCPWVSFLPPISVYRNTLLLSDLRPQAVGIAATRPSH